MNDTQHTSSSNEGRRKKTKKPKNRVAARLLRSSAASVAASSISISISIGIGGSTVPYGVPYAYQAICARPTASPVAALVRPNQPSRQVDPISHIVRPTEPFCFQRVPFRPRRKSNCMGCLASRMQHRIEQIPWHARSLEPLMDRPLCVVRYPSCRDCWDDDADPSEDPRAKIAWIGTRRTPPPRTTATTTTRTGIGIVVRAARQATTDAGRRYRAVDG